MNLSDHLDKLKAFKVAASTGKLRDAARKLDLTQPSLTRLIQTLETSVGAKIFYRSKQGVSMTPAGELLYDYSCRMLKEIEDLEVKLQNPKDQMAGHIRVGSYESLSEYLWPNFVMNFKKSAPHIQLSIKTNGASHHLSLLQQGLLDIVVDAEPQISGDFVSWVLYEDKFNFYAKPGFLDSLEPELAKDIPLIYVPEAFDAEGKRIQHHLNEAGYFFKEMIELDSFTAVRTFCLQGWGVAVLPERLAKSHLQESQLQVVRLKSFSTHGFGGHSICATLRANRSEDARLRHLIKNLKSHFTHKNHT